MTQKNLNHWVNKLEDSDLPILGKTMDVLKSAEKFIDAHSSQLTETILKDPNMTASVLKLANSALYSRNKKISTISRAILSLGFEAIRSLCISSLILESLPQETNPYLHKAIANAFQSALQARNLANQKGVDNSETIYIAALLYNLGEIAFWCSDDDQKMDMVSALDKGMNIKQAQEKVLGFSFNQLTMAMTKQWRISDVLQESLMRKDAPDSASRAVVLSQQLIRALPGGWEHPEVIQLMKKASKYSVCNLEKMKEITAKSAEASSQALKILGLSSAAESILLPPGSELNLNQKNQDENSLDFPQGDEKLQMNILRDLTLLAVGSTLDVNVVLQLVLEGIYKGIGMDRALVALIIPQKKIIQGKYSMQVEPDDLKSRFHFNISELKTDPLLSQVIQKNEVLTNVKFNDSNSTVASPLIENKIETEAFLCGPLIMQKKCVGLFYADRKPSKRDITSEEFEAFKFFVGQATLCLRNLN